MTPAIVAEFLSHVSRELRWLEANEADLRRSLA